MFPFFPCFALHSNFSFISLIVTTILSHLFLFVLTLFHLSFPEVCTEIPQTRNLNLSFLHLRWQVGTESRRRRAQQIELALTVLRLKVQLLLQIAEYVNMASKRNPVGGLVEFGLFICLLFIYLLRLPSHRTSSLCWGIWHYRFGV